MSYRVLLVIAMAANGCALAQVGEGKGSVEGDLYVQNCRNGHDFGAAGSPAPYNMNATFFVGDPVEDDVYQPDPQNSLQIRVQSTGNLPEEADTLWLTVADTQLVANALNTPIDVNYTTNVRGTLELNRTCLQRDASPQMEGTITFSKFGNADGTPQKESFELRFGQRLTASFDFDAVDERARMLGGEAAVPTTPAVAGHISGTFDFALVASNSAQAFQ